MLETAWRELDHEVPSAIEIGNGRQVDLRSMRQTASSDPGRTHAVRREVVR